jgi:aminoglycoside/choline kinase family phosphotransferase
VVAQGWSKVGEPRTVGLEPEWVAANTVVDGRTPRAAQLAGFIGTGQMSRNARFTLDWGDADGPRSVVVKVPSSEAGTRAISFQHRLYRNECEFYQTIAPLVEVSAPAALAVHFDPSAQDFAIVLEDLTRSKPGDQFTEPTDDQLILAIEQAAALQAPVWGQTAGPTFAPYQLDVEERVVLAATRIRALLTTVFDRLGRDLDPDVSSALDCFATLAGDWTRLRAKPTTLVHGDFRPDNFLFGVEPGAPPIAIVDWQTLGLGLGVTDVAYLLGAAVSSERRRQIEYAMLAHYLTELSRRGVEYPMDQCLADYALGSLHGVSIAITAISMADQTERGDALFTLMINRHTRHALDTGILDRIPSLAADLD